ncbi:Abi family protein [Corynebacterium sp. Z-1]|uniref:Abi family protein n=1 Tax=Corynebacterium sp. Z-1 TaxID=3074378 RepID=UPI002882DA30|nr:Abi family protein [Corynebacterium sp. Z-1]WNI14032.1 Abi family protein [Corynebacterium sp. Z-1]
MLKSATSIADQIQLLRSRGLSVDESLARQWLSNVSYYRLSAYWYPARQQGSGGQRLDTFVPGKSFDDVVALYEADRKLRTLVHDGMERVEITMRTRIGEIVCHPDPLAYEDPRLFRPTFNHSQWMSTARKRIARASRHNDAIKHYTAHYNGRYPFWVLAEVLDFSDISRLFEGLFANQQREISADLGFIFSLEALSTSQQRKVKTKPPLARWLEQLTVIRNTCAHHGRLWNKSFTPAPTAALRTLPQFNELPESQSERLYGALLVMAHILRIASPGTSWPGKIAGLINHDFLTNSLVEPFSLGLAQGNTSTLG